MICDSATLRLCFPPLRVKGREEINSGWGWKETRRVADSRANTVSLATRTTTLAHVASFRDRRTTRPPRDGTPGGERGRIVAVPHNLPVWQWGTWQGQLQRFLPARIYRRSRREQPQVITLFPSCEKNSGAPK